MKTKEEILIEIDRLKKKEEENKSFLAFGDTDCKIENLVKKNNYVIRKEIKKLMWVLS
jgi:hypothetical protein